MGMKDGNSTTTDPLTRQVEDGIRLENGRYRVVFSAHDLGTFPTFGDAQARRRDAVTALHNGTFGEFLAARTRLTSELKTFRILSEKFCPDDVPSCLYNGR